MRKQTRNILLFSFCVVFFAKCIKDDQCSSVVPLPPSVLFSVVDSLTGRSLIGLNRLYHPDTINKLNSNIFSFSDTLLEYNFGQYECFEHYIFKLSETIRDTIAVKFEIVKGECFTIKRFDELYYNGMLVRSENGLVVRK